MSIQAVDDDPEMAALRLTATRGVKLETQLRALNFMSGFLTALSVLFIGISVLGGVGLMTATSSALDAFGDATDTTHPYTALGWGVIASGVFTGLFVMTLSQVARVYATTVQMNYELAE